MSITAPNLVTISQMAAMAAELLRFSFFQDGGRPSWILIQVKNGVTARCGRSMSTTLPNFVTVHQPAAELLRFAKKYKMAASAILNLYLAILVHPRSSLVDLKLHRKFGVNRTFTFKDIVILKFCKFGLKRLFRPQNLRFWGVLTPKCYFSLLRPPKGTSLAANALWALIGHRMTFGAHRYAGCRI